MLKVTQEKHEKGDLLEKYDYRQVYGYHLSPIDFLIIFR